MTFKGNIALVTGGTGDLGQSIVDALVARGMKVAFTFHSKQALADTMTEKYGKDQVCAIQTGENTLKEARAVLAQVKEQWTQVDYLVNSVGLLRDRMFVRMEEEDWRISMNVNLDIPFHYCRAAIFDFLKAQQGVMVNVSSVAALMGAPGQINYAAAKAGVLGMTRALAREAARFGIRVNAVAPGYIHSQMTDQLPEKYKTHALDMIPMARFGAPGEVAAAVLFLLSDEARYITGQTLVVDGGMVMK